jgi:hypothetical protein
MLEGAKGNWVWSPDLQTKECHLSKLLKHKSSNHHKKTIQVTMNLLLIIKIFKIKKSDAKLN